MPRRLCSVVSSRGIIHLIRPICANIGSFTGRAALAVGQLQWAGQHPITVPKVARRRARASPFPRKT